MQTCNNTLFSYQYRLVYSVTASSVLHVWHFKDESTYHINEFSTCLCRTCTVCDSNARELMHPPPPVDSLDRWRQLSEPADQVVWVDLLTKVRRPGFEATTSCALPSAPQKTQHICTPSCTHMPSQPMRTISNKQLTGLQEVWADRFGNQKMHTACCAFSSALCGLFVDVCCVCAGAAFVSAGGV